jgi:biopolymer transport protein ExbB/TolQ
MELFYHLPMNWQQVWGVLKWVLAALVAGFVGQFGKSLALFLMKRRRARRGLSDGSSDTGMPRTSSPSARIGDSNQMKVEKKRAKAQVKRLKKF